MDVADTIEHYERSAREYAKEIDPLPPAFRASALRRMASLLPTAAGKVLEVGSGTGRDADYRIDHVLSKVAAVLRPGGPFLVSVREGSGESAGPAGMTFWSREFAAKMSAAGFALEWDDLEVDSDDDRWLTFLARRMS